MTANGQVRYPAPAMRVLLVTPPMIQLNTPYPATAYLTGFLRLHAHGTRARGDAGRRVDHAVPALVLGTARAHAWPRSCSAARTRRRQARRRAAVDRALSRARRALRGDRGAGDPLPAAPRSEPGVPHRRARSFCPKGRASRSTRARRRRSLAWAFGALGTTEQARYLASLYVDDLADVWRHRHRSALRARALRREARRERGDVRSAARSARRRADAGRRNARRRSRANWSPTQRPDIVGVTAPFPGNVYGAFRMARSDPRRCARKRRSCSAAAGSTRSCARCAIRACSTTSTT